MTGNKGGAEKCEHVGVPVAYDSDEAKTMDSLAIRKRFPRFHGNCPDCGQQLIKYASFEHYIAGDW